MEIKKNLTEDTTLAFGIVHSIAKRKTHIEVSKPTISKAIETSQ